MTDSHSDRDGSTHFGYSEVPLSEKQHLVDDVFHKVARRYDVMNDLMSGGLHRLWKDTFAGKINARNRKDFRHLDVAGGTDTGILEAGMKTLVQHIDGAAQ